MSDESKIDTNLARQLLCKVRDYRELRKHSPTGRTRARHYVKVGTLTREQAFTDRTWQRMIELGLVAAEPASN